MGFDAILENKIPRNCTWKIRPGPCPAAGSYSSLPGSVTVYAGIPEEKSCFIVKITVKHFCVLESEINMTSFKKTKQRERGLLQ